MPTKTENKTVETKTTPQLTEAKQCIRNGAAMQIHVIGYIRFSGLTIEKWFSLSMDDRKLIGTKYKKQPVMALEAAKEQAIALHVDAKKIVKGWKKEAAAEAANKKNELTRLHVWETKLGRRRVRMEFKDDSNYQRK